MALQSLLAGKLRVLNSSPASPKVILVDGNNMVFAAYHGYGGVDSQWGMPGVAGSVFFLADLVEGVGKDNVYVVVWDSGRSKRRLQLYPEYKAHRDVEDKKAEREKIHKDCAFVEALVGLTPFYSCSCPSEPTEGDDIIHTAISNFREEGIGPFLIVSDDKDLLSEVSPDCSQLLVRKGLVITDANVDKYLGFSRDRLWLHKAIAGDTSDNLKGVPGVGEKTATDIVRVAGSLDELREAYDGGRIKGGRVASVLSSPDVIETHRQLIQLEDVPYDVVVGSGDKDGVTKKLEEAGLHGLVQYASRMF